YNLQHRCLSVPENRLTRHWVGRGVFLPVAAGNEFSSTAADDCHRYIFQYHRHPPYWQETNRSLPALAAIFHQWSVCASAARHRIIALHVHPRPHLAECADNVLPAARIGKMVSSQYA